MVNLYYTVKLKEKLRRNKILIKMKGGTKRWENLME